ncbi:MAG: hypothetical protein EBS24_07930 [Chitinophagia bacterium]|jgi:hypothetical protein|nr:hypothetical protein [Chitinophagia bacterium]
MENKNEIRLKKIPLLVLLEALKDVYERGADYVDIIGVPGVEQDSIGIAINREYFAPEDEEDDDDSITDEDLNQLI